MATTLTEADLFTAALALPQETRLELAEKLVASVGKPPGVWDIDDPEFGAELDRRWAAYKSGEMPAIELDEAIERIRNDLTRSKSP